MLAHDGVRTNILPSMRNSCHPHDCFDLQNSGNFAGFEEDIKGDNYLQPAGTKKVSTRRSREQARAADVQRAGSGSSTGVSPKICHEEQRF